MPWLVLIFLFLQGASVSSPEMAVVYPEGRVTATMAREMLDALDEEYARIRHELQCVIGQKITAVVMPLEQWEAMGHPAWSGGAFDGRILVPLVYERSRVGPRMRQVFAHETVHACVARFGPFPTWLHEGLAQYLSGERLPEGQKRALRQAVAARRLPGLEALAGNWSGLAGAQAQTAYAYALWAVEVGMETEGAEAFRQVLRYPANVPALTVRLNEALQR